MTETPIVLNVHFQAAPGHEKSWEANCTPGCSHSRGTRLPGYTNSILILRILPSSCFMKSSRARRPSTASCHATPGTLPELPQGEQSNRCPNGDQVAKLLLTERFRNYCGLMEIARSRFPWEKTTKGSSVSAANGYTPPNEMPPSPIHQVLVGQKALVTGASKGLGQAMAIGFAQAGADVLVNYSSDEQGARQTAESIERLGRKAVVFQGQHVPRRRSAGHVRLHVQDIRQA